MSAPAKSKSSSRAKLLAQVHLGTAKLFGRNDEDAHRDYLEAHTGGEGKGKRSCEDLTDLELAHVAKQLRQAGALDGDGNKRGGAGPDRPTRQQWAKLGGLARQKGWKKGLESEELQAFVKRTAKVTSSRFLTRASMTAVISGLEQWIAQGEAKP